MQEKNRIRMWCSKETNLRPELLPCRNMFTKSIPDYRVSVNFSFCKSFSFSIWVFAILFYWKESSLTSPWSDSRRVFMYYFWKSDVSRVSLLIKAYKITVFFSIKHSFYEVCINRNIFSRIDNSWSYIFYKTYVTRSCANNIDFKTFSYIKNKTNLICFSERYCTSKNFKDW